MTLKNPSLRILSVLCVSAVRSSDSQYLVDGTLDILGHRKDAENAEDAQRKI